MILRQLAPPAIFRSVIPLCRDGFRPPRRKWEGALRILLIAAVLFLALAASARGSSQPDLSVGGLEERMLADAADGRLDAFTPLEAALIAGGVSEEAELRRVVRLLRQLADDLPPSSGGSVRSQIRQIHEILHDLVLSGDYSDDAADVSATLAGGEFNCLTATILFNELCRHRGLTAEAVSVPGHVFSRVENVNGNDSESVDVQTTDRDWFRRDEAAETGQTTGRRLTAAELVAKLYYNRGVRFHRGQRYAESVESLRTAYSLDPHDADARDNLLAAINNWALAECAAGRYRRAAELLADGRQLDATFTTFAENDVYVAGRWADALCAERDYRGAMEVLQAAQSRHPEVFLLERAMHSVRALQPRHRQEGN